ncbi:MAG TPA: site-2 protease family protein [Myxococcota bacterium]|nr:site-2 protease family protein [Myxococcota bacterium]
MSETAKSLGLFIATLVCVYFTYGYLWHGGDPLGDPETMVASATFALALMAILGAHEMGHYLVARRHGFELSLPYFIPVPFFFGTFGAVIRLRSLPANRSALLEMGAAGPIAGAVVAFAAIAVGLPDTGPPPEILVPGVAEAPPAWLDAALTWLDELLAPIAALVSEPVPEGHVPVLIFNNPLVMDLFGILLLGAPPGRFDTLSPLALAGWVGCFLTALNLVPIGQLDGGHIVGALFPSRARLLSRVFLGLAVAGGVIGWSGWLVWAVLLWSTRAFLNVEVPSRPPLTPRARWIAVIALALFALTFMAVPVEPDVLPYEQP